MFDAILFSSTFIADLGDYFRQTCSAILEIATKRTAAFVNLVLNLQYLF